MRPGQVKQAAAFSSLLLFVLIATSVSAASGDDPLGKPRMDFRNGPLDPRATVEKAALGVRSNGGKEFVPYRIFVSKGTYVFNVFP